MSQHYVDPLVGIPVMRFCDRLDGYAAGMQAAIAFAKQLRTQEAIDAQRAEQQPAPVPPEPSAPTVEPPPDTAQPEITSST